MPIKGHKIIDTPKLSYSLQANLEMLWLILYHFLRTYSSSNEIFWKMACSLYYDCTC